MYDLNAEIKGWDWSELAGMLGVVLEDDSGPNREAILQSLNTLWEKFLPWGEATPEDEEAVAWIRHFLEKLAEEGEGHSYLTPFFLGIATIEDAQTMIQKVEENLGSLWT